MTTREGGFRPLKAVTARWSQEDGFGTEHVTLEQHDERITATAVVTSARDEKSFAAWYQIFLDSQWQVKAVSVHRTDSRWFIARCPEPGRWCDGDGTVVEKLQGCRDIALQASRFTITPMIRRLSLMNGDTFEQDVFELPLETLVPVRRRQMITCVEIARIYQVEDIDSGSSQRINVDDSGMFVNEYKIL